MHIQRLRAAWSGASIPTAPYAKGYLKIDWTGEVSPRQFRFASAQLQTTQSGEDHVAEKLSGLPEPPREEAPHRIDPLPLRQVRLEGLTCPSR
jgi:hypothetical protein